MRKFLFKSILVLAALTFAWGCGSSSDEPDPKPDPVVPPEPNDTTETPTPTPVSPWVSVVTTPVWFIDWNYTDERPDWKDPDFRKYDNWMVVMVKMPDPLITYISPDDMMAIFINGELRGLSSVATVMNKEGDGASEQSTYFIVKVYSNSTSDKTEVFGVQYYSSQLHHLFAVQDNNHFVPHGDLGVDQDYVPPLLQGSSKYPVFTRLMVKFVIDETVEEPLVPMPTDYIGVFVGDQCRGYTYLGNSLFNGYVTIPVYSKEVGEPITLRYFSASKHAVQVFQISGTTKQGNLMTTITI